MQNVWELCQLIISHVKVYKVAMGPMARFGSFCLKANMALRIGNVMNEDVKMP